jgi:hypothetical protein
MGTAVSLDCNFLVWAANEKKALFFLLPVRKLVLIYHRTASNGRPDRYQGEAIRRGGAGALGVGRHWDRATGVSRSLPRVNEPFQLRKRSSPLRKDGIGIGLSPVR